MQWLTLNVVSRNIEKSPKKKKKRYQDKLDLSVIFFSSSYKHVVFFWHSFGWAGPKMSGDGIPGIPGILNVFPTQV